MAITAFLLLRRLNYASRKYKLFLKIECNYIQNMYLRLLITDSIVQTIIPETTESDFYTYINASNNNVLI